MSLTNTRLGRRHPDPSGEPPPRWRWRQNHTPAAPGPATVEDVVGVGRLLGCLERNRRAGGQAPGPDGFGYPDFGRQEAIRALQLVRDAVLAGTYRPVPPRLVRIPKPTPGAFRTLALDDLTHRALTTSVLGAVAPLYAPHMSPITYSAGSPPRGVFGLLADLAAAWEFGEFSVLLNLDIKNAFPSVPVGPLMAVVSDCIADDRLLALVELLVRGADAPAAPAGINGDNTDANTLGIPQGSALSPAHLDLYLSAGFDARWSNPSGMPSPFRYVDNIAYLTGGVDEGRRTVATCRDVLARLGLYLRDQPDADDVIDFRGGTTTDLLGFTVFLSGGLMAYGTSDAALDSLRGGLRNAHEAVNPSITAQSVLLGWINAMGPSSDRSRAGEVVHAILSCARRLGFKEFSLAQIQTAWSSSFGRWNVKFLQPARARAGTSRRARRPLARVTVAPVGFADEAAGR